MKMFNKQTNVVKIFWDNENNNKLLYGGGTLYVISQLPPIYQWENFNEKLIIKANIMVNIFIIENSSQIVHIEDHLMFYNSKQSKVSGY